MEKVQNIVVHCSDSEWGCAREIRRWHLKRGWVDIGYHLVILNARPVPEFIIPCLNGSIELGRPLDGDSWIEPDEIGAHALGYNALSIGVCGIAKSSWTRSQTASLVVLLRDLQRQFGIPTAGILGHCETPQGKAQGKTCPNLDMTEIRGLVDGK